MTQIYLPIKNYVSCLLNLVGFYLVTNSTVHRLIAVWIGQNMVTNYVSHFISCSLLKLCVGVAFFDWVLFNVD